MENRAITKGRAWHHKLRRGRPGVPLNVGPFSVYFLKQTFGNVKCLGCKTPMRSLLEATPTES